MKIRPGLVLSITISLFTTVLMLGAFNHSSFAVASTAEKEITDSYFLENSCLQCHSSQTPDVSWYCHKALQSDTYDSRMYLRLHLDWVTGGLTIPPESYVPSIDLSNHTVYIHIFNTRLYPNFITISPGTTVTWTNLDVRNQTIKNSSQLFQLPFDTITLKPGERFSCSLLSPGIYEYTYLYDEVRPVTEQMYNFGYGKIIVTAPG